MQGSEGSAPSCQKPTGVWGGAPDAAAILQLFQKYAFLGIFWSKFLFKTAFSNG